MKNEEVQNVVKILGLRFGTKYDESNLKTLRYGHLMIMTDQDHDGRGAASAVGGAESTWASTSSCCSDKMWNGMTTVFGLEWRKTGGSWTGIE